MTLEEKIESMAHSMVWDYHTKAKVHVINLSVNDYIDGELREKLKYVVDAYIEDKYNYILEEFKETVRNRLLDCAREKV